METNPRKCHIILSSNTQRIVCFYNATITSSLGEKLLAITLDSELEFEEDINKIFNIVNKKLNVLHLIASHTSLDERKILLGAFIESQFPYFPLFWMFRSRTFNKKTDGLHVRIVYGNYKSKFYELLKEDGFLNIHHKNIQMLLIETFNFLKKSIPTNNKWN